MQTTELDVVRDIPGYKVILRAVIKNQIQQLVDQLADSTGEESMVLIASLTEGSWSHLGTEMGRGFLQDHENIKSQFLGFCLKRQDTNIHQRPDEQSPPVFDQDTICLADVESSSTQNLYREQLHWVSNQFVPSGLNTTPNTSANHGQLPFLADDSPGSHDMHQLLLPCQESHENVLKSLPSEQYSGKQRRGRGRGRKRCGMSNHRQVIQNDSNTKMEPPTHTEPLATAIKMETMDTEIDSLTKPVTENLQSLCNYSGDGTESNSSVFANYKPSMLTVWGISEETHSENKSNLMNAEKNNIIANLAVATTGKSNNKQKTGRFSDMHSGTNTDPDLWDVDSGEDLTPEIKTEGTTETDTELEITSTDQHCFSNNHVPYDTVAAGHSSPHLKRKVTEHGISTENESQPHYRKVKRKSADYMKWYRNSLKSDPSKREQFERHRESKRLQNEKYRQKVKLLRQKCEAYDEAMKVKQVLWTRKKRERNIKQNNA